jgi:twinkle protein
MNLGQKLQKDIIYRLGSWRTKFVEIPHEINGHKTKDINEVLYWGGKEMVSHLILNATETPVNSIIDYSEIQDVDLDELDGMILGIEELDKALMKIPFGSFNIVTGVNGTGKSSFLSQIMCNALEQDLNIWLYSKELPNFMAKNWLNYPLAGRRNLVTYNKNNSTYFKVDPKAKKQMDNFYKGRVHIYKDEADNDIDSILQSMEDSVRKFGDKLLIVDNLTAVDLGNTEESRWDKQTEFIKKLISFAKKFNVVIFLVIHPHKMDMVRRMNIMDIQGSMSMTDLAHRCFSLYRVSKQDKEGIKNMKGGWVKEPIPYDVIVDVLKDRFTGKNGLSVGMYYDYQTRRFFSNETEFNYQYKWDTKVYKDKLEYPIKMPY